MKNIGIIGLGWLGAKMAEQLHTKYTIFGTTTTRHKAIQFNKRYTVDVQEFGDDEKNVSQPWLHLSKVETIIITVPFSRRMQQSQLLHRLENLTHFIQDYKGQLFLMSSTGIYPQENKEISEKTYSENELHPNLLYIEKQMKRLFPQVNILRLGGLMGANRKLRNYSVSNTSAKVNYVHFEDIISLVDMMIEKNTMGKTYNVVAPMHPTRKEILEALEKTMDTSPPRIPSRVISSDKVQQEMDFKFQHPNPKFFA